MLWSLWFIDLRRDDDTQHKTAAFKKLLTLNLNELLRQYSTYSDNVWMCMQHIWTYKVIHMCAAFAYTFWLMWMCRRKSKTYVFISENKTMLPRSLFKCLLCLGNIYFPQSWNKPRTGDLDFFNIRHALFTFQSSPWNHIHINSVPDGNLCYILLNALDG